MTRRWKSFEENENSEVAASRQRLKELQGKRNEEISRRRSASEETRSYVQEEITVEKVEERIPSPTAADLEWLFPYHGCSGLEHTYKYFQLFSMKYREEDAEYTQRFV